MTFLPMLGALVIFFIPRITPAGGALDRARHRARLARDLRSSSSPRFDPQAPFEAGVTVPFQERIDWGQEVGASYFLGIDGIAALLLGADDADLP